MKVTIDRFEGDYAVVEMFNRQMVDMPRTLLPEGVQEGDIVRINIDRKATDKRKKYIEKLTKDLWE